MLKCYSQTANPGLLREPIKELEVKAKTREKNGVKDKKATMGRQQWKVTFHGPHKKRGRPKLSDENLNSDAYKERRRLKEVKDKFIKEMGKDMGTREYNFWRKNFNNK